MGGKNGEYYLVYFGEAAPVAWPFVLYKQGPVEGMAFAVETLVTWNLTVTPVDGVFTLKRKDDYEFIDRDGRAVALPGKPYLALRLRHLGPATVPVPVATEPGP